MKQFELHVYTKSVVHETKFEVDLLSCFGDLSSDNLNNRSAELFWRFACINVLSTIYSDSSKFRRKPIRHEEDVSNTIWCFRHWKP